MTETNDIIRFNPTNLESLGAFHFEDNIGGQLTLAHPHLDVNTGEIINISIQIGKTCEYHVYKVMPGTLKRIIIKTLVSNDFFYMHSFSITPNYIVLFKTPLCINKWKVMFGSTISNSFYWKNTDASYFIVINRNTGETVEIESEPFVCLHSINSFEKANELVLDLACYTKGNPYDCFYLDNLRSNEPHFMNAQAKRYILNLSKKQCQMEPINDHIIEFPRINYKSKNGSNYTFAYMGSMTSSNALFLNAIHKLNVNCGQIKTWQHSDYYPGEPLFIAKPHSEIEDEGIIMFIAYNNKSHCSALMILDAQTMLQRTEIPLPLHLPMGLHSNFYSNFN